MKSPDPYLKFISIHSKKLLGSTSTLLKLTDSFRLFYKSLAKNAEEGSRRELSLIALQGKLLSVMCRDVNCSSICREITPILKISSLQPFEKIQIAKYAVDELKLVCQECHREEGFQIRPENILLQCLRLAGCSPAEFMVLLTLSDIDLRLAGRLKDEVSRFAGQKVMSEFSLK